MRPFTIAVIGTLLLSSCLVSSSLVQTLQMKSKTAAHLAFNRYTSLLGTGISAPFMPGPTWVIGDSQTRRVVRLQALSFDGGKTLNGWLKFSGDERDSYFWSDYDSGSSYYAQIGTIKPTTKPDRLGTVERKYQKRDSWIFGSKTGSPVTYIDLTGNENVLNGKITYLGSERVSVRVTRLSN